MTANQAYKEYKNTGGTLKFKDWIDREKKKMFMNADGEQNIPLNQPLNDSISQVLNQVHKQAGYKTSLENKYIFGVNKTVWIAIGVVAAVGVGYYIYKTKSK